MKKAFLLIILIAASIAFVALKPNEKSEPIGNDKLLYNDPDGKFSFIYPRAFAATGREEGYTEGWRFSNEIPGTLLATVIAPKSYMPGTNFSEAALVIGTSADPKVIESCSSKETEPWVEAEDALVGRRPFTKFTWTDAGAGNIYEMTGYRAVLGGECFSLEYAIHYTNIGNYDPSQGVQEFDKDKIKKEMDEIVESFRFEKDGN